MSGSGDFLESPSVVDVLYGVVTVGYRHQDVSDLQVLFGSCRIRRLVEVAAAAAFAAFAMTFAAVTAFTVTAVTVTVAAVGDFAAGCEQFCVCCGILHKGLPSTLSLSWQG